MLHKMTNEAKELLNKGVYDPLELYDIIQHRHRRVHYSQVRKAIHIAKTGVFK